MISAVKITKPKVSGVTPRPRLFRLLDAAAKKKPVMVIVGPAGAGKTTLAASWLDSRKLPCLWYQVDEGDSDIASFFYYLGLAAKKAAPRHKKSMPLLTPEYLQGIPTFTRRYFEELFRRLKAPFTVVLDNFQDASDPAFHKVVSCALETIPEGINVLILSRTEPPAQLARMRANNRLAVIGWNELSFTPRECGAFLKTKGEKRLSEETVRQLHDRTDGWAAGLVLMTEMAKTKEIDYSLIGELSRNAVFNYFASEIFEKTDKDTQEFLLKTSFLPSMSIMAAEALTGNAGAGSLLSRLSRHHYFTDWRPLPTPVFQYHPLFREFLQSRAKDTFNGEELGEIRRLSAAILEKEGRIEVAASLFVDTQNWEELVRIILGNAGPLVLQGRTGLLGEWISRLPADIIAALPWLPYWAGICRMPFGPASSRPLFEQAFRLFREQGDEAGTFLAWAAVVETFQHEWRDQKDLGTYIDWLSERVGCGGPFPSPEIAVRVAVSMTAAQIMRRRSYDEFRRWAELSLALAGDLKDIDLRLRAGVNAVQFYVLTGDFVKAKIKADDLAADSESPAASPLTKVLSQGMVAFVRVMTCDSDDALSFATASIRRAEEIGIHIWDDMFFALAAFASLNAGDLPSSATYLERMKSVIRGGENGKLFLYHLLLSLHRLLGGDAAGAHSHAELALSRIRELAHPGGEPSLPEMFFSCYYALAHSARLLRMDTLAGKYLELADDAARHSGSAILEFMSLIARSCFAFEAAEERKGLFYLRKAMAIGRKQGFVSMLWWWDPVVMADLSARALMEGIEVEYVRDLIRKRRLPAPDAAVGGGNWPYPVRILTLGRFRILKDEEVVEFSGKVKRKPLDMVKALVALGGRDVSERQLADMLWPDADGDAAHKSFEMTLLRLRRLLGRDDAVALKGGSVSLDEACCWVDVRAFESMARRSQETWRKLLGNGARGDVENAVRLSEKAIEMYEGEFLPNDTDMDCTTGLREKMRNLALQQIALLGSHWEKAGQWRRAIECYRKGIEIDRLFEDFYRCLMVCHEKLGQRGEAGRAYQRCYSVLSSELGIEPSERTKAVYSKIRIKA